MPRDRAWAGEGLCRPTRLGWWQTDLVDEGGGGYLFRQLLPQTHRWATLEAVRATARRVDRLARERAKGREIASEAELDDFLAQLRERILERLASGRGKIRIRLIP